MVPSPPHQDDRADGPPSTVQNKVRSALIDIAPIVVFTVTFALTRQVVLAVALALACGVIITVRRLMRKEPAWRALGALAVIGIGGLLATQTGNATNFFVPSLVFQGSLALVSPVMMALGWPPLGLAAGLVTGEGTRWRRCPLRRRAFTRANLVLLVGKLLILSVEIPLFLADQTVVLGVTNSLGPVVHGVGALLAWRLFRRMTGNHRCTPGADRCEDPESTSPDPQQAA
ncbi:DUF3159 domain-containing protein [Saccharopolyspora sp. NPDC000359]|uniref:DUF3159 domain-containing protein n=1 Tax=Saccharopolyspora sp. NPDC000359 TaxID=3154251 RepID=UPI00331A60FE